MNSCHKEWNSCTLKVTNDKLEKRRNHGFFERNVTVKKVNWKMKFFGSGLRMKRSPSKFRSGKRFQAKWNTNEMKVAGCAVRGDNG